MILREASNTFATFRSRIYWTCCSFRKYMLLLGVCLRSVCGVLRAMRVLIMQMRWVTYILKGWRGEFTVTRDRRSWAWFQKASRGTLDMRMVIRGSYDILRFDSARMLAAGMQAYVCRCVLFMYPHVCMYMQLYAYADVCVCIYMCMYICICRCIWS